MAGLGNICFLEKNTEFCMKYEPESKISLLTLIRKWLIKMKINRLRHSNRVILCYFLKKV